MNRGKLARMFVILLLLTVLGAGLLQFWRLCCLFPVNDFLAYWTVTEYHAQEPHAPLYGFGADVSIAGFARSYDYHVSEPLQHRWQKIPVYRSLSTPFLFWVVHWFPRHYEYAWKLFLAISFLSAVGGTGWFMKVGGFSVVYGLLSGVVLMLGFRPTIAWAQASNVGALQLGMLALISAALVKRTSVGDVAFGVLSALFITFKPNLMPAFLLVAVWQVAGHEWLRMKRELVGGVVTLLAVYIIGVGYAGDLYAWIDWLNAVQLISSQFADLARKNFSLYILAEHYFGGWNQMKWVSLILLIFSAVGIYRVRRRSGAAGTEEESTMQSLLVLQTGVLMSIAVSPLAWSHYYVLCMPALVLLVGVAWRWNAPFQAVCAVLALIGLSPLVIPFFVVRQPAHQALISIGSLLMLLVAIWVALATNSYNVTGARERTVL